MPTGARQPAPTAYDFRYAAKFGEVARAILQELELHSVDVVKIDVEGFEDEVILPFLEAAPARLWPKAVVLEHCHRDRWGRDCEAALLTAGFSLVQKDRTNLMFERGAS